MLRGHASAVPVGIFPARERLQRGWCSFRGDVPELTNDISHDHLLETREALRESEQRLRAMFQQAAVGIAISNLDGRIAEANGKFVEILGYSTEELQRVTAYDITHPEDVAATRANVQGLLDGDMREYSYEKRYIHRNGSIVWTITSVGVLRDPQGRPRQFIGVIEDITDRKHLQEAERAARAEAERMSELKDQFLATLSHELRTPLSAILGWTHVIASRPMQESELRRAVQIIERNARAQTRLIDDLLDMARISSGQLRLDVQPVEPAAFIEAALETVRPSAEAKSIRLVKVLDPRAGPVSGDPGRLQQVVWNLLANAIKFSPDGGKVEVVLQRVDSSVEISVADNGAGISAEFLPHVFVRFRQADGSITRRQGGLGLGLAIAKHLVELQGGSIRASSEGVGRGATFTVQLPLTSVHRSAAEGPRVHPTVGQAVPASFPDLSGLFVLAVDDQPDARELVQRVLEDCGAKVLTAENAARALEAAARERPDVLLSDIGMPEMDGFELMRRLRSQYKDLPAIALTAYARSEDRINALRAGFRMHVAKPVEPAELAAAVANVAGRTG